MIKIFRLFLKFLERITGKKIIYYKSESSRLGKTAAKSSFGFWYAGNIVDFGDLAYGILENGLVEKDDTELVVKILKKIVPEKDGDFIFYDVGANTGYYGILSAYLFRNKIKTASFDPVSEHTDCLKESVKMNNLENNIKIFTKALGSSEQEVEVFLSGTGTSLIRNFMSDKNAPARKIGQTSIDILISRNELSLPDFIKIDVEGFELNVLRGAEQAIKKNQPVIFYETVYYLPSSGYINNQYEETVKLLRSWGYTLYNSTAQGLKKVEDHKPNDISMFLCLHEEKHKDLLGILSL